MRIALIGLTYPFRGGISQYTTSLYKALEHEHEVLFISFARQYPDLIFPGKTQIDESLHAFSVPAEELLDSLKPLSWKRVADRLVVFRTDLVLFQWWQPFFGLAYASVAARFKQKLNSPVLYLCHNIYSHETNRFPGARIVESLFIRRAFKEGDGFLVHSQKLVDQLKDLGISAPVKRIYHPTYDFYDCLKPPDSRLQPAIPADRVPQILYFGNVRKYKGLEMLLGALSLVKRDLEFRAVIAGEWYLDKEPYQKLAQKLGISDWLIWEDRYIPNEEVPAFFQQADVVVLPYHDATQSGVVPLAYQFEVPAIASDVGGLSEVVLHGKTGYLFPARQPEALAERILQYFRENRKSEFQSNIRAFRQKLNWNQVVDAVVGLYEEIKA